MITLYGMHSPYVHRVRAVLQQKGLDFEHVSVNLMNRSEEFTDLNPLEKIPVLKDQDGTVIFDSTHIAMYLDQKYIDTYHVFSKDPQETAKILNITAIANHIMSLFPPIGMEKMGMLNKTDKTRFRFDLKAYTEQDETEVRSFMLDKLTHVAKQLDGREYFVADRLTFADIAFLSLCHTAKQLEIDISPLSDWYNSHFEDEQIATMFTPKDQTAVGEI